MKKVYIFVASLLATSLFYSQELTASASSGIKANVLRPSDILYTQAQTTNNGIVSDVLANGNFVASTDDFVLTQSAEVSNISILGFQNQGTISTVVTGIMLYIYADNSGMPAGIPGDTNPYIAKIDLPSTSSAYSISTPSTGYYQFDVDVAAALGNSIQLTAGTTYWLVFAPKTNLTAYTGTTRWNWSVGDVNTNNAKLVDPANAFGAGATNWTDISALTQIADFDGLAFTLEGTTLGVGEVYSSIKELVVTQDKNTQELFVFLKNNQLKNVEIYSADGRKVLNSNETKMSISSLKSGVYIVKVNTIDGKIKTTKFIK